MHFFLLIFFTFMTTVKANAEDNVSIFKISEKNIKFYNYPKLKLTVSKPCEIAEAGKLCDYLSFLNKISLNATGLKIGGLNPASVICEKTLQGKVHIGIDTNNNENSFCYLKDGFYIDGGTINFYAEKNDGITQKPRRPIKE